mmetsp:Transcript_1967/g.5966  ORF Transcript_1967/g.5966 Transcript_1967/m.5966 type:complete len:293 (+) Transcript_1967:329-1207(+)
MRRGCIRGGTNSRGKAKKKGASSTERVRGRRALERGARSSEAGQASRPRTHERLKESGEVWTWEEKGSEAALGLEVVDSGGEEALGVVVSAGHASALGSEGAVRDVEARVGAVLAASGEGRVVYGEKGGGPEEEGRLADGSGGVDGERVGALGEDDAEVEGRVVRGRDLVGAGAFGEEGAGLDPGVGLGVPDDEFLQGEEAVALGEGAFDLADVDRGVERAADVHDDVDAAELDVPREGVELNLGDADARGEVVEGLAALGVGLAGGEGDGEVVAAALAGHDVEALGGHVDP